VHADADDSGLQWTQGASLRELNSFGVDARASVLAVADNISAVVEAIERAESKALPLQVLGGGSNILLAGDVDAVVLVPRLRGIEWLSGAPDRRRVRVAAGENWHDFVDLSLREGAFGLENLALIPGTIGASPIQNIGAYGVEVEAFIEHVEVYDRQAHGIHHLTRAQCEFSYRDSVFKRHPERYIVLSVEFELLARPAPLLEYAGIADELIARGIAAPSSRDVFNAVCAIRRQKLPDPAVIGNAGSFFKNPVVTPAQADSLRHKYPNLPVFAIPSGSRKLAAAWMIDQCGWKGARIGDAGVHSEHALVLVNHGRASGAEILALSREIQRSVQKAFDVQLEPEPRVLGATGT